MVLQITEEYEHRDKYPDMVSGWMAGYKLIREDISHYFSPQDLLPRPGIPSSPE
jgi:hypothetical protein